MNLFKSVFSADPEPADDPPHQPDVAGGGGAAAWGLGGFVRAIASRSESVLESYSRDLREFGTGLRRETAALGEAAASAAQGSLESVGRVVDDIADIIVSHGKDALLSLPDASDYEEASSSSAPRSSKRYSRFDALVLGLRSDQATFLEDPEDVKEFEAWREGFDLGAKEAEIGEMCREDGGMEGMLQRLVPKAVDYETFWIRYFYKVHKLKQAEDARAELVKRVISAEEEEELSWEVDEEEEEDTTKVVAKEEERKNPTEKVGDETGRGYSGSGNAEEAVKKEKPAEEESEVGVLDEKRVPDRKTLETEAKTDNSESRGEDAVVERSASKMVVSEEKAELSEPVESCKDSDFSVVSSQPEVDDLGWDEIEDLQAHEEKNMSPSGGSSGKVDLRKRLSVAEDDDDLSWDIEDD